MCLRGRLALALALVCLGAQAALAFPEYERGKGKYQWILNETDRENGITFLGAHQRLRAAVSKLHKGEPLKVVTVGGSITAGQGAVDAPNWPTYLFNYLQDEFGKDKVTGHNGAVGGTVSAYMSVCHNLHIPKDTDVVFVEYSVNDWHNLHPLFENSMRRAYERLLRKLLKYPNGPAVVLVHSYCWLRTTPRHGVFWGNTEREFNEFAGYYHLPSLSVKSAAYQRMQADEPGFLPGKTRNKDEVGLKNVAFYYDDVHPDGRTGARVTAELAMHLIQRTYDELKLKPSSPELDTYRLPPPMIPDNYESQSDKCFIGNHYTQTVKSHDQWEWINESKTERPKWGYVTKTVGAVLKMLVDTRASANNKEPGKAAVTSADAPQVLIELAYLRSYEHMGKARVTCEGDCKCLPSVLDGHHTERNSQLFLHTFYATQGQNCYVVVTVLPETSSGEHKFKMTGIMLSEESGEHEGIRNSGAVEYVSDISQRGGGTFEVNNHARRRALQQQRQPRRLVGWEASLAS